jgi:ribosomal protein S18 acetylase RimI-like enzyme
VGNIEEPIIDQPREATAGASTHPAQTRAEIDVVIRRLKLAELDQLEPLWSSLRLHHAAVAPGFGPPRERADSWLRRRGEYGRWLAEPRAFALVAERSCDLLGYAMVHTRRGSSTWPLSEPAAELETLSVLPSERRQGIGAALLDAVQAELAASGIAALSLLVVAGNDEALRFYERHGFETAAIWMRRDDSPSQPQR